MVGQDNRDLEGRLEEVLRTSIEKYGKALPLKKISLKNALEAKAPYYVSVSGERIYLDKQAVEKAAGLVTSEEAENILLPLVIKFSKDGVYYFEGNDCEASLLKRALGELNLLENRCKGSTRIVFTQRRLLKIMRRLGGLILFAPG